MVSSRLPRLAEITPGAGAAQAVYLRFTVISVKANFVSTAINATQGTRTVTVGLTKVTPSSSTITSGKPNSQ